MNKIKTIVDKCQIREKEEILIQTKKELFALDRAMAKLTLDWEVGTYVHNLNEGEVLTSLTDNSKIREYQELRAYYLHLKETLGDYHKSINVDFRKELTSLDLPDIYIYQKHYKFPMYHHIILPNLIVALIPELSKGNSEAVFSQYELHSKRENRHFYNKTSFAYLEALTKDYDFSLESKDLGKVKIKKI